MSKQSAYSILAQAAPQYKTGQATKKAYSLLNKLASNTSGWGKAIQTNIKRYAAMGDFNPKKSAYYQNAYQTLRDSYRNQGRAAMQNAIASAAANTEGYGNSYGTTAGNQAYQSQLQTLAAKVPTLYSAAANEFNNQKSNLANVIGLQQAQQQTALDNAQFRVGVQQALDEQRYNAAVARDKALRELAKLQLEYDK
ncbi:MAG: hypothetical protein IJJ41_10125 [Clostridia bacterium]|nr:hypothetical protein [Clostridia bacterium]